MTENVRTEVPESGVDMFDDAYLAWFDAENECERALGAWSAVARGDGNLAYFAYQAALDREQAAARYLERVCQLAGPGRDALVELLQ
jgi:hypothetical protein